MNPNLLDELNKRLREQYSSLRDINVSNDILNRLTQQIAENEQRISDYVLNNVEITDDLIQINNRLVQLNIERIQSQQRLNELTEELKGELADVLGGSQEIAEIFKTGGIFALGAKAAISGFEKMGEQFSNIFETSFDMMKTLGVGVEEAGSISGELGAANVSMTGLLYGSEATAEAAKELADQYGIAGMATTDMIKGVTQLSALTGDAASAVDLALAYENAGIAASDVKANIQEIAGGVGVNANKVAKEMAENQDLIVSATKEELALNTRLTAQLVKQGITREAIKSSSEGLMDIENTIQEANKLRLLTGKQINVAELTNAAMAVQMAEGEEEKLKAQEAFANMLKNDVLPAGKKYSKLNEVTKRSLQKTLNITDEQLMSIEKAELAQKSFGERIKEAGGYWGYLKGVMAGGALGIADMGKEFAKMVIQAMIFNKVMTGSSGIKNLNPLNLFKKGGSAPTPPTPTPTPPADAGSGPAGAMGKINATSLIKGAAALLIMAAALFVFAKALQEFKDVGVEELGMAAGSIVLLGGALIGLSYALAPLAATGILFMVAAGMLALGASIYLVGAGFKLFAEGAKILSELPAIFVPLAELAGGIALFGLSLIPLSAGLGALAIGLALLTPFLPTLLALAALGTGLALVANFIGGDSNNDREQPAEIKNKKDPLLEEIRLLRSDIKNQPINVVLNNKIVGEINRGSRAINSYVNK